MDDRQIILDSSLPISSSKLFYYEAIKLTPEKCERKNEREPEINVEMTTASEIYDLRVLAPICCKLISFPDSKG